MPHFTEEQLKELEQIFKLERRGPKLIPIADGWAAKGNEVWWKHCNGPELVMLGESGNWSNAKRYPHLYSHKKPEVISVTYADDSTDAG